MPAIEVSNPTWDPVTSSLRLDVQTVQRRLTCSIPLEALLRIRSGADASLAPADLAQAVFDERRHDFVDVVRQFVWDGRFSDEGEIRLSASAFPRGW